MCIYDFFRDFIDGNVESLMNELEIEKSLRHHEDIVDEIECIEKTLLKRRAELREADRLLAEAESELSHTTEKVCAAMLGVRRLAGLLSAVVAAGRVRKET